MKQEITRTALDVLDDYTGEMPSVNLEPARLNWYHGATAGSLRVPGVWFGKETAFTAIPSAPWVTDERFIDGDGLGYSAPVLRLAFVGWRDQWFIPGETDNDKPTWLPNGQRAAQGVSVKKQIDYLVLVDGLADPMVLSVSGFYKSRPIEDIIYGYERGALAQLIRQRKKATPRWAHWLTIGGKVDAAGKPVIEKAKNSQGEEFGSEVTPPVLLKPPVMVEPERMMQGIETWNLYNNLGWFKFQRTNRDTVEADYTVEERPALPAPAEHRNVPQRLAASEMRETEAPHPRRPVVKIEEDLF